MNKIPTSLYRRAFIKNNARMKHNMFEDPMSQLKIINTAGIIGAVLGSWVGACVTYRYNKNNEYMQCVVMTTIEGMIGACTGYLVSSMMPILLPISISIVVGTTIARQFEPPKNVSNDQESDR